MTLELLNKYDIWVVSIRVLIPLKCFYYGVQACVTVFGGLGRTESCIGLSPLYICHTSI